MDRIGRKCACLFATPVILQLASGFRCRADDDDPEKLGAGMQLTRAGGERAVISAGRTRRTHAWGPSLVTPAPRVPRLQMVRGLGHCCSLFVRFYKDCHPDAAFPSEHP